MDLFSGEWPVCIIVPMEPRSVNTYTRHCIVGGRIRRFKHANAKAFEKAGAAFVNGQKLEAKAYAVRIDIFLGKGSRSDLDNLAKQPLDLLVTNGVIHSDAAVVELHMTRQRDRDKPRTEIRVRAIS